MRLDRRAHRRSWEESSLRIATIICASSPNVKNWMPTTISRTPRSSSGRSPIASPPIFSIVR